MGWKLVEKPKTMLVTKALVKEFLSMSKPPYDRPLSERRMQVYRKLLSESGFRPCTWASAYCKETKDTYRVNGKHTSTLLSKIDRDGNLVPMEPVPEFYVTVERYVCDEQEDVSKLYSTFDSSIGSRTSRDINHAFAAVMPELKECKAKAINLSVTALGWEAYGIRYSETPAPERAELLLDNSDFCCWFNDIAFPSDGESKRGQHLQRGSVATAMLGSYRKAKGDATEFWKEVRDESDPDRDSPTRKLARFLTRTVQGNPSNCRVSGKQAIVTMREMYVKCIHAWNAWRKNEETDLKYYSASKEPAFQ